MIELRGRRRVVERLHFLSGTLYRELVQGPFQEILLQQDLCQPDYRR